MLEKCSTAQSFIRTEMTTYRIGTLVTRTMLLFQAEIEQMTLCHHMHFEHKAI